MSAKIKTFKERLDSAMKFIEASHINDMTNQDIIDFVSNFPNNAQSKLVKDLVDNLEATNPKKDYS